MCGLLLRGGAKETRAGEEEEEATRWLSLATGERSIPYLRALSSGESGGCPLAGEAFAEEEEASLGGLPRLLTKGGAGEVRRAALRISSFDRWIAAL